MKGESETDKEPRRRVFSASMRIVGTAELVRVHAKDAGDS